MSLGNEEIKKWMKRKKDDIKKDRDRLCGQVVKVPGYRSRGHGFDSRRYWTFWEAVGLERGPFSLVSATEELLGINCNGSCLEIRGCGRGNPYRCPRGTLYPHKLALTSPTSGDRSIGIIRSRTKATVFSLFRMTEINILRKELKRR
jgi:hypothetical protein